jgi:hypothetical protein
MTQTYIYAYLNVSQTNTIIPFLQTAILNFASCIVLHSHVILVWQNPFIIIYTYTGEVKQIRGIQRVKFVNWQAKEWVAVVWFLLGSFHCLLHQNILTGFLFSVSGTYWSKTRLEYKLTIHLMLPLRISSLIPASDLQEDYTKYTRCMKCMCLNYVRGRRIPNSLRSENIVLNLTKLNSTCERKIYSDQ